LPAFISPTAAAFCAGYGILSFGGAGQIAPLLS
jgi:hypothetical protein